MRTVQLAHAGGLDEGIATLLFLATGVLVWVGGSRLRGVGFAKVPRPWAWVAVGFAPVCLVAAVIVPVWLRPDVSSVRPATTAAVSIVSPEPGEVFVGDPAVVDVDVRLDGATVVPTTSTNLTSDEGHIHLLLDGRLLSMTEGLAQQIEVGPGAHVLQVAFVAVDHGPFDPPVQTSVAFEVRT